MTLVSLVLEEPREARRRGKAKLVVSVEWKEIDKRGKDIRIVYWNYFDKIRSGLPK